MKENKICMRQAYHISVTNRDNQVSLIVDDCDGDEYFRISDLTWRNLQQEIKAYMENCGGVVSVKEPIVPKVDFEELFMKLKSNIPITSVSCQ